MENLISFNDILKNVRHGIEVNYPFNTVLEKWDEYYKDGELTQSAQEFVTNVINLSTFLRVIVGVGDGREYMVVLRATTLAFKKAAEFNA